MMGFKERAFAPLVAVSLEELGFAHGWNRCDPFTRNRNHTGDAWQNNLTTDVLMVGEIPTLPDRRQTALSLR
jgi:hypothetical protein